MRKIELTHYLAAGPVANTDCRAHNFTMARQFLALLVLPLFALPHAAMASIVDFRGSGGCESWNDSFFFRPAMVEEVQACLDAGADPNRRWFGSAPLHWAVIASKDIAVVRVLLKGGADPNAGDNRGWTPLHYAAFRGNGAATVAALVKAGADPNAQDKEGMTPLHRIPALDSASNMLQVEPVDSAATVTALVKAGADPNAQDKQGQTPLHRAAAWGMALIIYKSTAVVTALLDAGADPRVKDHKDRTPGDLVLPGRALDGTEAGRRLNDARAG